MKQPVLTCPRCGNSGALRNDDTCFEDLWPLTRGHLPVRECRQCGAGIIVRPTFGSCRTRATLIADDTWSAMKATFAARARPRDL
jgi:ribosomal protein S27AE